jgi:acyl-CoA reductase-like NAD-dependent aldehyde dehydrogenase
MYDNLLAAVPTDLWIGGRWRTSSDGARFDVFDPATENVLACVASATVQDAAAAVDAAQDAFGPWAARKPRERAEILRKAHELVMRDAERLAKLSPSRMERRFPIREARSRTPRNSSGGMRKKRSAISERSRSRRRRARASWSTIVPQAWRSSSLRGITLRRWPPGRSRPLSPPVARRCSNPHPIRR